tara:strand:+ start:294 stop:596 length:303 start_codon:yes stop_codon:yes gene_type:complete
MEQTTTEFNPEQVLNDQVNNWWKTSPTVNKVRKSVDKSKKAIKKEASERPLWKVALMILIVSFMALGRNIIKYGVKPTLIFPLAITIYPAMEGWFSRKRK